MQSYEQVTLSPLSKAQPLLAALICVVAGILCASAPFMEYPAVYATAAGLLFCVIAPAWNDWRSGRLDIFEPIHVIGLVYFMYFGMGSLWAVREPEVAAYDMQLVRYIPRAAFYVLLGYLAMLAGYYGPWWRGRVNRREERLRGSLLFFVLPGALGLLGSLAAVVHVKRLTVGGLGALNVMVSSVSQLAPLLLFGWALQWLLFLAKRDTARQRMVWLLLFIPGTLLVCYLTISNKTVIVTLAVIPIIALWYARRRIPWLTILLLLVVLIFGLFPLYNTYRVTDVHADHSKRLQLTYRMVQDWSGEEYVSRSWGTFKGRMAMINSVAVVLRDTGRWVPYAKGETVFMPTLTFFIPRLLWPDKPVLRSGREFAEKFRITNSANRDTFIAATVPGELYWNFDLPGVIVGMALFGALMRWLYRRYGAGLALDPVRRALYIVILFVILLFDGGIAPSLVNLVRMIIAVEVLRWIGRNYGYLELVPEDEPAVS